MTRPIKFRAWHEGSKSMDSNPVFKQPVMPSLLDINAIFQNTTIKFMQYTGLKDKNGVEIYEGDIVREYPNTDWEQLGIVAWQKNFAGYGTQGIESFNAGHEPSAFGKDNWTLVEVIGNIYENKELLK